MLLALGPTGETRSRRSHLDVSTQGVQWTGRDRTTERKGLEVVKDMRRLSTGRSNGRRVRPDGVTRRDDFAMESDALVLSRPARTPRSCRALRPMLQVGSGWCLRGTTSGICRGARLHA